MMKKLLEKENGDTYAKMIHLSKSRATIGQVRCHRFIGKNSNSFMPLADTFTQDDFFLMSVVKILRMIPSITSKTEERFLKRSLVDFKSTKNSNP